MRGSHRGERGHPLHLLQVWFLTHPLVARFVTFPQLLESIASEKETTVATTTRALASVADVLSIQAAGRGGLRSGPARCSRSLCLWPIETNTNTNQHCVPAVPPHRMHLSLSLSLSGRMFPCLLFPPSLACCIPAVPPPCSSFLFQESGMGKGLHHASPRPNQGGDSPPHRATQGATLPTMPPPPRVRIVCVLGFTD